MEYGKRGTIQAVEEPLRYKAGRQEEFLHCLDKSDCPLATIHVDHLGISFQYFYQIYFKKFVAKIKFRM